MAAGAPPVSSRPGESDTDALLRVLSAGSRSFSLAGRLLKPSQRAAAAAVYAWCRRADDLIDDAPPGQAPLRLAMLRSELDALYAPGGPIATGAGGGEELALRAFAQIARERRIPRQYPDELVNGMEMDVLGQRYQSLADLKLYCYRVASTVGLMMCHVMGVKDDRALAPAAHLGVALQLTNISRDVLEDWHMGRLYLPLQWLPEAGPDLVRRLDAAGPHADPGELPTRWRPQITTAVRALLTTAERYYASADRGLLDLPLTSAAAIRSARWIYRGIGEQVWARDFDVWQGRAVVPTSTKLRLLGTSMLAELARLPLRIPRERGGHVPQRIIEDPAEVLAEG